MNSHCDSPTCQCRNPYAIGTQLWVDCGIELAERYANAEVTR